MNKEVTNHRPRIKKNPILYFLPFILCLLSLLTGCVDYDVGINFDSPYDGTIVQHIQVGEQISSLNQPELKQWLNSIEERAHKLQGKVKRISSQELAITIPFTNGKELVDEFNQFFYGDASTATSSSSTETTDSGTLNSKISLKQSNLLLVERNHLYLTVDLRALDTISAQNKIAVKSNSFINLTFQLNAPWIAHSLKGRNLLAPTNDTPGKLIWQLQPGQINQIEAIVWLPSPLGIGTAIVLVLMIAGFYVKYRHFPGIAPATTQSV